MLECGLCTASQYTAQDASSGSSDPSTYSICTCDTRHFCHLLLRNNLSSLEVDAGENPCLPQKSMLACRSKFGVALVSTIPEGKLVWRVGSRCDGGSCIEVGRLREVVMIRNSAARGTALCVSDYQWQEFVARIKAGAFDQV